MLDTVEEETSKSVFQLAAPVDSASIAWFGLAGPDAGNTRLRPLVGSEKSNTFSTQTVIVASLVSGTTYRLSLYGRDTTGVEYLSVDTLVYDETFIVPVIQQFLVELVSVSRDTVVVRATALASLTDSSKIAYAYGPLTALGQDNIRISKENDAPLARNYKIEGDGVTDIDDGPVSVEEATFDVDNWYLGTRNFKVSNLALGDTMLIAVSVEDTTSDVSGAFEHGHSPTPILVPFNGSVFDPAGPTLDWEDLPGATTYQLVYSDNAAFLDSLVAGGIGGSSHSLGTLADGTYYWKVRGISANGAISPASSSDSFVIIPTLEEWLLILLGGGFIGYLVLRGRAVA